MTDNIKRIQNAVQRVLAKSAAWIRPIDGKLHFVDPVDRIEISAHYGATYMAASMVIWGIHKHDERLEKKGLELLKSILDRWNESVKLTAFHYDFNNFALCALFDALEDEELKSRIRETVIKTADSNHLTINWLPMRMAVNQYRYAWTGDDVFRVKAEDCLSKIRMATHPDGGIEDRLPKGVSFNLQYDLATVAVQEYTNVHGGEISIEKELGFLLNAVSPDGDINYQGRGTNQIFAWGLWVYLLAATGREHDLSVALDYLEPQLGTMLDKHNIMLNQWDGAEKYLWWDYHYASVYTAHLLFWLVQACLDYGKNKVEPHVPSSSETGLHIYCSDNFFVSWFDGRSEYLSEKGPAISCIWSKEAGIICKGAFAPWHSAFGKSYSFDNVALLNYCGLIEQRVNGDISQNRIIHKLFPTASPNMIWLQETLVFCPIQINEKDNELTIKWEYAGQNEVVLNIPAVPAHVQCEVFADGTFCTLTLIGKIRNQYGWVNLFQSRPIRAATIILKIS